jgi:hypothetical protein
MPFPRVLKNAPYLACSYHLLIAIVKENGLVEEIFALMERVGVERPVKKATAGSILSIAGLSKAVTDNGTICLPMLFPWDQHLAFLKVTSIFGIFVALEGFEVGVMMLYRLFADTKAVTHPEYQSRLNALVSKSETHLRLRAL